MSYLLLYISCIIIRTHIVITIIDPEGGSRLGLHPAPPAPDCARDPRDPAGHVLCICIMIGYMYMCLYMYMYHDMDRV